MMTVKVTSTSIRTVRGNFFCAFFFFRFHLCRLLIVHINAPEGSPGDKTPQGKGQVKLFLWVGRTYGENGVFAYDSCSNISTIHLSFKHAPFC